jgi:hypothetical protein
MTAPGSRHRHRWTSRIRRSNCSKRIWAREVLRRPAHQRRRGLSRRGLRRGPRYRAVNGGHPRGSIPIAAPFGRNLQHAARPSPQRAPTGLAVVRRGCGRQRLVRRTSTTRRSTAREWARLSGSKSERLSAELWYSGYSPLGVRIRPPTGRSKPGEQYCRSS